VNSIIIFYVCAQMSFGPVLPGQLVACKEKPEVTSVYLKNEHVRLPSCLIRADKMNSPNLWVLEYDVNGCGARK